MKLAAAARALKLALSAAALSCLTHSSTSTLRPTPGLGS
jgi:hypothetical protein